MKTVVLVFAAALMTSIPMDAYPCGNAVFRLKSSGIAKLVKAEKLLRDGDPRKALRLVSRLKFSSFGKKVTYRGAGQLYLDTRAKVRLEMDRRDRIAALAVARTNGRYDMSAKPVKQDRARRAVLLKAAGLLKVDGKVTKAPTRFAVYAQALERVGADKRAYDIFRTLYDGDLLADSWSLAAFARVSAAVGQDAESSRLFERCKTVAGKRASKVCVHELGPKS